MFCSSLRQRPLWLRFSPGIATSTVLKLQETETPHRYDICVRVGPDIESTLEVLLVEPGDLRLSDRGQLVSKIRGLAELDNEHRFKFIILVQEEVGPCATEGYGAFTELQNLLLVERMHSVLLVPTESAATIIPTIASIARSLSNKVDRSKHATIPQVNVESLLALTTATAPIRLMSEQERRVLKMLFPDLKSVEQATRTPERQRLIIEHLGEAFLRDVQAFWDEEWIV